MIALALAFGGEMAPGPTFPSDYSRPQMALAWESALQARLLSTPSQHPGSVEKQLLFAERLVFWEEQVVVPWTKPALRDGQAL